MSPFIILQILPSETLIISCGPSRIQQKVDTKDDLYYSTSRHQNTPKGMLCKLIKLTNSLSISLT